MKIFLQKVEIGFSPAHGTHINVLKGFPFAALKGKYMELMMAFRIHGFLRIELATFSWPFLQDFSLCFPNVSWISTWKELKKKSQRTLLSWELS